MEGVVRVKREVAERMLEEARREPAKECCGLLAGRAGVITCIFPAANLLDSARAYEIAPEELFRRIREMRAAGLEHLGIYHSHPEGANAPSAHDLERAYYPDVAYFILSPLPEAPQPVRAFRIRNGRFVEVAVEIS